MSHNNSSLEVLQEVINQFANKHTISISSPYTSNESQQPAYEYMTNFDALFEKLFRELTVVFEWVDS
jgi:hypothetical protein